MPAYSIAMTTYNCDELLGETLSSLENFGRPFELVVVDAGSTDRTRDVVEEWAADSPNDLTLEVAPGDNLGEGRQRAMELADGDHVLVEIEGDVVYEDVSAVLPRYEALQEDHPGTAALVTGNNGFVVGPKELLVDVGFRPLQWREDQSFHDRLYRRGALRVLTEEAEERHHPTLPHRIEVARTPDGEEIVTRERERELDTRDYVDDWYGDSYSMFRIGFSLPQVLMHCFATMEPHEALATVPISVASYVRANRDGVWDDVLGTSYRDIYRPKWHDYYDSDVLYVPETEDPGVFSTVRSTLGDARELVRAFSR